MDLNTITEVLLAADRADLADPRPGDAFLAGGTGLFGAPADHLRRLIDLTAFDWPALTVTEAGVEIAATCTVAELCALELPEQWPARALIGQCCDSLLASFKIWNRGTVGGNLCIGYPAGPMISLAAALDGIALVWTPDGGEYRIPVADFVIGDTVTVLKPGEVLRSMSLPAAALTGRTAFRTLALAALGRSSAVIIARRAEAETTLCLTASTNRPYVLRLAQPPADLTGLIDSVVRGDWVDDIYGAADWRRQITLVLAAQVLAEVWA